MFCAVVDAGSFTAAAAGLHYTQSGVSRRIAALERISGGALFTRQARGVRATEAGRALHGHARDLIARLDAAAEDLRALRDGVGGRLRIGAFATANAALLPHALARFRAARGGVHTTVREALSPALLDGLRAGTLDAAVVSDYPTGTLDATGLELRELGEDPMLVALAYDHPLATAPNLRLRDLASESWIEAARHGIGSETMLAAACERAGFVPRSDIDAPSWAAKLGYVAAGLGVTLIPRLATAAVRSDVVLRSVADDLPRRRVCLALPPPGVRLSAAMALGELVTEEAADLSGDDVSSRSRDRR
ncbi:LysR family transcriptional regulator [Cryptosporangium minutisporangium]|uniref:LysR family transcriptional regulator n=1 Tax=Cryptosporangium minutisporangium TaxID=113569 RepID=A0ABP6T8S7_9ACTN